MSDQDTLAATPGDATNDTNPVNDGFIDLDAQPEVTNEPSDDDQPKPEGDKAKPEGEEEKKKPSGAQRAKIREQRLLNENAELQRRLDDMTRSTSAAKPASESADKPPREEDFNGDFFAYQTAKTAYEAGK